MISCFFLTRVDKLLNAPHTSGCVFTISRSLVSKFVSAHLYLKNKDYLFFVLNKTNYDRLLK